MSDKKLTPEAIVKGLDGADVFLRDLAGSTNTSLDEYAIGILFNIAYLCGDAADLINIKNAEIERLTKKVEELSEVLSDTIRIRYAEAKAQAVNEFVDMLKREICDSLWAYPAGEHCDRIDDIVKEWLVNNNAALL